MTVEIRLERPEDRDAALAVEVAAFGETSEEDVRIVRAVRDEDGSFALVAVDDGEVVGHAQYSRAWIGAAPVLALGPIGVVPDRQRGGIGSALIEAGFTEARRRGETAVFLLGDPRYSRRFGFAPALELGLRNPFAGTATQTGFTISEEDFQIVVLDAEVSLDGAVRWHPAFG